MCEFNLLSWNIEQFGTGKLAAAPEIASTVKARVDDTALSPKTPFLGFLLEVKGKQEQVTTIRRGLRKEFRRAGLKGVTFKAVDLGGASHTREWIISMSRGLKVRSRSLNLRSVLKKTIRKRKVEAQDRMDAHQSRIKAKGLRARKNHPLEARTDHFRPNTYEADWYRDGFLFRAQRSDGTGPEHRIAAFHAPNPRVSNQNKDVIDAITQASRAADADIIIGDLNYLGKIERDGYKDISASLTTGTTLRKGSASELGQHRWDRVIVSDGSPYASGEVSLSVAKPRPSGGRVSDHAMISALFGKPTPP